MNELIENLVFSALFPEMDRFRRFDGLPPSDEVCRVFMRAEAWLFQRYGYIAMSWRVHQLRAEYDAREVTPSVWRIPTVFFEPDRSPFLFRPTLAIN